MSSEQLTLDDALPTDPPAGRPITARQHLVLRALAEHGPLTDFDHHAITGLAQTNAGKRRLELQRRGLVEATGASRSTGYGGDARVWAITEAGYRLYLELREDTP